MGCKSIRNPSIWLFCIFLLRHKDLSVFDRLVFVLLQLLNESSELQDYFSKRIFVLCKSHRMLHYDAHTGYYFRLLFNKDLYAELIQQTSFYWYYIMSLRTEFTVIHKYNLLFSDNITGYTQPQLNLSNNTSYTRILFIGQRILCQPPRPALATCLWDLLIFLG